MLDNLRDQTSFQPDEEEPEQLSAPQNKKARPPRRRRTLDQITGMTAPQRFMLSLMLLVIVCLLGSMLLILTGKVILPIGG
ncbi:MAG TPA: hypothetical protein VMC09_06925 [Anaerolineales bacterium]|nr:hypothetical protein [Anaerolineales bacterium]